VKEERGKEKVRQSRVVTYRISGWQRVPIWYTMSREGPFEKD
jgi:hypothetical protein